VSGSFPASSILEQEKGRFAFILKEDSAVKAPVLCSLQAMIARMKTCSSAWEVMLERCPLREQ